MLNEDDKEMMEEVVKNVLDELLETSGVKEAMETINNSKKLTREKIMEEKNPSKRQKLIKENMELFKED